jgi:hypothetical protein
MTTKVCSKCDEEKELGAFCKSKDGKYGVHSQCRKCVSEYHKLHYQQHSDDIRKRTGSYYEKNKEKALSSQKKYKENNIEAIKEWRAQHYKENSEQILKQQKEYYEKNKSVITETNRIWKSANKDKMREWHTKWQKERRKNDIAFRIRGTLHSRVTMAVKKKSKKAALTMELIGCTVEQLRTFLEAEFEEGMSWDNYGRPKEGPGWEIDHIRPCASFNLEDPEEQKKCFHWTNLQPLWALDNILKGDKWSKSSDSRDEIPDCTEDDDVPEYTDDAST